MKYLLLASLVGLLSCRDPFCVEQADQTAGLVIRVLDRLQVAYDQGGDLGRFGVRISTTADYRRLFATNPFPLDSIDFRRYDILGLSTINKGLKSSYSREVTQDDAQKKIVYTVTEHYCQRSSPVEGKGNFILVAKLPVVCSVQYIRQQ